MSEQPHIFDGDEVCFCPICGGKVAIATMTHKAYGSLRQISFYCNSGKTECFDAVSKIFPEGKIPWEKIRDAHNGKLDEKTLTSHKFKKENDEIARLTKQRDWLLRYDNEMISSEEQLIESMELLEKVPDHDAELDLCTCGHQRRNHVGETQSYVAHCKFCVGASSNHKFKKNYRGTVTDD